MDQFEAFKAMGEFWTRAGTAFFSMPGHLVPDASGTPTWPGLSPAELGGLAEAQAALAQSWASATELSTTLAASLQGGKEAADPTASAVLAKIFDPKSWLGATSEFDETLTRMAEGPRLADLWTVERKYAALFTAWAALRRAQVEHNAVMLDGWTRAAGTFAKTVNARGDRGESFASSREMMTLWIETANTVLLEVQRSESFLKTQRALLKTSTDLRLAQQEISAFTNEMYGQPTRAEIDDVHKGLTELRREVRALHRAMKPVHERIKTMSASMSEKDGQPTRADVDDVRKDLTELRQEVRALHKAKKPLQESTHG